MDRGAWWAIAYWVAKSLRCDLETKQQFSFHILKLINLIFKSYLGLHKIEQKIQKIPIYLYLLYFSPHTVSPIKCLH